MHASTAFRPGHAIAIHLAAASILLAGMMLAARPAIAAEFTVETATVPEMKAVFGQVESRIVLPARGRIGGSVLTLGVSEGDMVQEGQTIALVVDEKIALQLQAAEAQLRALNSQLANARIEYERAQQLRASGTGTQSRLDTARTQLGVLTNQVAAAEADKGVIEQNAREGAVLAPANGRVLGVPVTPGSVILAGEVVARIAPGPYYLRLSLPERHATEIVQGAEVLVGERGVTKADTPLRAPKAGRIAKLYPEISDGRVIADVEVDGIGDYFVNERMLVSIPVGRRDVVSIPPEALHTRQGIDFVRILIDGRETEVAVIPGERFEQDGQPRIEVLTGLQPGDRVVLP